MFANKHAKPFAQLARLRCRRIKATRPSMRAKMRRHVRRYGVGLFEPSDQVAAIRQPLDLGAPRRCEAVEKIKRQIIANEERCGARLGHQEISRWTMAVTGPSTKCVTCISPIDKLHIGLEK